MDDLITRLTAAIDKVEQLANDCIAEVGPERAGEMFTDQSGVADRDSFPSYPWGSDKRELAFMAGAGHPSSVLRGCAADRKLIARGGPFCDCDGADSPPMDPATNWTVPIPHHYDCRAYEAAKIMAERYEVQP